jgi:hypothetical protein
MSFYFNANEMQNQTRLTDSILNYSPFLEISIFAIFTQMHQNQIADFCAKKLISILSSQKGSEYSFFVVIIVVFLAKPYLMVLQLLIVLVVAKVVAVVGQLIVYCN